MSVRATVGGGVILVAFSGHATLITHVPCITCIGPPITGTLCVQTLRSGAGAGHIPGLGVESCVVPMTAVYVVCRRMPIRQLCPGSPTEVTDAVGRGHSSARSRRDEWRITARGDDAA